MDRPQGCRGKYEAAHWQGVEIIGFNFCSGLSLLWPAILLSPLEAKDLVRCEVSHLKESVVNDMYMLQGSLYLTTASATGLESYDTI